MKTIVFTADRQHHEGAKQKFEIQRLERCESAWTAVFDLIMAKNRAALSLPVSSKECVLLEINRLYNLASMKEKQS